MSKITIALESAVALVIANKPKDGEKQTARQRVDTDRAFAHILKLIAPRIRHFIRQYGLAAHWDDAEQVCAIGVHRAIQGYDPEKAQFTTFVNWQIRGELQGLRFRLMTDQRPSAKKVDATTVSLHATTRGPEGEETSLESLIEDESATALTEAAAADYLASSAMKSLVDSYIDHLRTTAIGQLKRRPRPRTPARPCEIGGGMASRPRTALHNIDPEELLKLDLRLKRNREIVESRLFELPGSDVIEDDAGITKERVRQIAKRAAKTIGELAGSDPKFQLMANYRKIGMIRRKTPKTETETMMDGEMPLCVILPEPQHNGRLLPMLSEAQMLDMAIADRGHLAGPQSNMRH
ncbi:sigma-70 family RNA polymerase sigma factor [Sphingobium boeckii]|uniref:RNA polymerase sigma-32 factor n=1 Tax=Sphingobium boeckii TaxID=1082345 RepID=A0A7W9AGL4_9SPHN|nr:sigma-70 family RNA polymerase sigma factor [Sphingobium boeckii]MBB5685245.1 RNA polymerase sigma-32 factor [Sphingobium boeckii]